MTLLEFISSSISWTGLLVALAFVKLAHSTYVACFHLRDFPGPRLAAYSRLWMSIAYAQKNAGQIFLEVNQQFGHVVRIGPNHLLTDDADITWRILAVGSRYQRSPWFDSLRFHPHHASIASERDPIKHDLLRAKVSAGYNTREFLHLEELMDNQLSRWLARLQRVADARYPSFDIGRSVRTMTIELSSHISFSEGLELGNDDEEAGDFWQSLEKNAPYAQYLSVYSWMFSLSWALAWLPGMEERILLTEKNDAGVGRIMKVSRMATEKRFGKEPAVINDMLGSWIKHGLSQNEAETESSIAMVTGAFPVASAINTTLLHVCSKHNTLQKLMKEIDACAQKFRTDSAVPYAEISKLSYLRACLLESLRCFPPITQLRERIVPSPGDTFGAHFVPAGTLIGLNTRALQQHKCFGNDPSIWRPERWLDAAPADLAQMRKIHDLVFGYGPTKCLGVTQAFMVMTKVLFESLRRFDMEIIRPEQPWVDQNSGVSLHRNFTISINARPVTL